MVNVQDSDRRLVLHIRDVVRVALLSSRHQIVPIAPLAMSHVLAGIPSSQLSGRIFDFQLYHAPLGGVAQLRRRADAGPPLMDDRLPGSQAVTGPNPGSAGTGSAP